MITPTHRTNYDDTIREHIGRLRDGCVLLSREALEDPNFKITVVLTCIYNKEGTFGLVCNRPSHMPINEVFNVDSLFKFKKRNIYIGGPVQQESLHIIQITDNAAEHAYKIAPQVYLGGEWESIEAILSEDSATTRIFLGYSGWTGGQLEFEIAQGAWEVYNVDVKQFLIHWEEPLFQDIDRIREYLNNLSIS